MSKILPFLSALGLFKACLVAQTPEVATYSGRLEALSSYSAPSRIRLGDASLGDMSAQLSRIEYLGTRLVSPDLSWSIGGRYARWDFSRPDGAPFPSSLQAVTLPISAQWKIHPQWQAFGELSPGLYSDFVSLGGDDFNAPFIGGVGYAISQDLQVFLSVSVDVRRDIPVVGGPGVRWKFAEDWTLLLLLPRPQVQYRLSENWMIHAGAEIAGGAFHLHPRFGTERGIPAMDNQIINYREIRTGVGIQWGQATGFNVALEAGWMIDRRFLVDDLRLQYNGEGAAYARLGLSYRY